MAVGYYLEFITLDYFGMNMLPHSLGPATAVGPFEPLAVGFVEVKGDPAKGFVSAGGH